MTYPWTVSEIKHYYLLIYHTLVVFFRAFGGQVSWFETVAVGATYDEADETITHQIVDRPNVEKKYLSR